MIYVFWADYNGAYTTEFENCDQAEAEEFLVKIRNKDRDEGEQLVKVVQGNELFPKDVEKISKIKLSQEA